jgi:hypothetical protein
VAGYSLAVPGNYIKAPFNLMFFTGPRDFMRITESPFPGMLYSLTKQKLTKNYALHKNRNFCLARYEVLTEVVT